MTNGGTLHVTSIGYDPRRTPEFTIAPQAPHADMGTLQLVPSPIAVEGIEVEVERPAMTLEPDRNVYAAKDVAPAAVTASEVLAAVPAVMVDQDGRVSLRGNENVAVQINGRPAPIRGEQLGDYLRQLPANVIDRVEVIPTPSARQDPEGMAGIINIIYRQEQQLGLSGDLGLALGAGQFTKQRPDLPTDLGSYSTNEKIIPSANLNYRTARTRSFFQGELLLQDDLPNNEFHTRFYDDGRVIESQVPENREQLHYIVKGGSDWTVNGANTVSMSGIYDWETHTDRAQVPFILTSTGARERFWFWRENEDTGFANVALNLKHLFATSGHELNANVQYTRGWEDEAYFLNEISPVREGTDNTHVLGIENTLPLTIDYTRPLRAGRMELGTKLQRRWLPVTYTVGRGAKSVIYEGLGDRSDWTENIYAAYANLVRIQGAYSLEGGVRLEHTQVTYTVAEENIVGVHVVKSFAREEQEAAKFARRLRGDGAGDRAVWSRPVRAHDLRRGRRRGRGRVGRAPRGDGPPPRGRRGRAAGRRRHHLDLHLTLRLPVGRRTTHRRYPPASDAHGGVLGCHRMLHGGRGQGGEGGQDHRRHQLQDAVLRPADLDGARQRAPRPHHDPVHAANSTVSTCATSSTSTASSTRPGRWWPRTRRTRPAASAPRWTWPAASSGWISGMGFAIANTMGSRRMPFMSLSDTTPGPESPMNTSASSSASEIVPRIFFAFVCFANHSFMEFMFCVRPA